MKKSIIYKSLQTVTSSLGLMVFFVSITGGTFQGDFVNQIDNSKSETTTMVFHTSQLVSVQDSSQCSDMGMDSETRKSICPLY